MSPTDGSAAATATEHACPVCQSPIGDESACALCEWPLRSGYVLGPAPAEEERTFRERMQAAQRRFDLAAAVRAAGFPDAGQPELLARLERLVRAGPPAEGERKVALEEAEEADRATERAGPAAADDLARRAAERGRDVGTVAVVEVDAEGIAVSTFAVDGPDSLRQLAGLELREWPSILPGLPDDPDERRLWLAGGIGEHAVAPEQLDVDLEHPLAAVPSDRAHVVLVCRLPGWRVPEHVFGLLSERLPAAERVVRPHAPPEHDAPEGPVVVHCPEGITTFAVAPADAAQDADDAELRVAAGTANGTTRVWALPGSEPVARRALHEGRVTALDVTGGGTLVASGGKDGSVRLWSAEIDHARALAWHDGWVNAVRLIGGAVFSVGDDGQVRRTPVGEGSAPSPDAFPLEVGWSASTALAVTGDGGVLAVGGTDGLVTVRDGTTGETVEVLPAGAAVTALAIHPADRMLAVGCAGGGVGIYSLAEVAKTAEGGGHGSDIRAIALTRRGSLIAGDEAGAVRLWRAKGEPVGGAGELVGTHEGSVRGVGVSANGRVVSAGADGVIRVWEVEPA